MSTACADEKEAPVAPEESTVETTASASATTASSVTISPAGASINIGQKILLEATVRGPNGELLQGRPVQWTSRATSMAIIDANGQVTGRAEGQARIEALVDGVLAATTVSTSGSMNGNPGRVADLTVIAPTDTSVTLRFSEVSNGQGGAADYDIRVGTAGRDWWSSTNVARGTCVAPVKGTAAGTSRTCTVLGLSRGTAYRFQMRAFRGVIGSTAVFGQLSNIATGTTGTVAPAPVTVASVALTPTAASAVVGGTSTFTATARDANGNTVNGQTFTWTSSNPSVATVNASGTATAVAAGNATITAATGGRSGTAAFTVTAPTSNPRIDLRMLKSASPTSAATGASVVYTMTARNLGPVTAANVVAGDTLPAGMTYVSHTATVGTYSATTGRWTIGSLGVNQEAILRITATINAGTGGTTITNRASVGSSTPDSVAANNTAQASVTVTTTTTPPPPPPPPSGGLLFASNWSTATGTGVNATGDGGRWTDFYCDLPQRERVMAVVPGAQHGWTATPNVLQMTMDGTNCALIQNKRDVPAGQDYYVRMYIKVQDANVNTTNHPYKTGWRGSNSIIMWSLQNRNASARTYRPAIRLLPTNWVDPNISQSYDINFLGPVLSYGQWYRFETKIEYVGSPSLGRARMLPRIYDMAGNLIADANSYVNTNGTRTTTLQKSINDGAYYQFRTVDGYMMGHIHWPAMGYEGPAGNQSSSERYFFAGFEARTGGWPGPITP